MGSASIRGRRSRIILLGNNRLRLLDSEQQLIIDALIDLLVVLSSLLSVDLISDLLGALLLLFCGLLYLVLGLSQ